MLYAGQKCNRRLFLRESMKWSAVACLSCTIPTTITSCSNASKDDDLPENYYTFQKEKLLKDFDSAMGLGQAVLAEELGETSSKNILIDAKREYENIIPEIPYIGGDDNENSTSQLLEAAQYLALYRVLAANGKNIAESGQIIYGMFKARLNASPQFVVSIWGYFKFHVGWSEKIKKYAAMSQKRKYATDFVYTFIEGDGETLDYGVNMTECAIQKFLRKQSAEELTPYFCAFDYPISKRFNRGLIRNKTLVESNVCDFRYKKDRETQTNLPEGLKV